MNRIARKRCFKVAADEYEVGCDETVDTLRYLVANKRRTETVDWTISLPIESVTSVYATPNFLLAAGLFSARILLVENNTLRESTIRSRSFGETLGRREPALPLQAYGSPWKEPTWSCAGQASQIKHSL